MVTEEAGEYRCLECGRVVKWDMKDGKVKRVSHKKGCKLDDSDKYGSVVLCPVGKMMIGDEKLEK